MATPLSHSTTSADDIKPKKPSRTNSWERVVVFDPDSGNVEIQTRQKVNKDKAYFSYKPLTLPKRRKSVSLYMQQDNETVLKTEEDREDSDKFVARLTFNHLSLANKARFLLGLISTIYVAVEAKSSNSSFCSD